MATRAWGFAVAAIAMAGVGAVRAPAQPEPTTVRPGSIVKQLRDEAISLRPLVASALARRFLAATDSLPAIEPRVLYYDAEARRAYPEAEALAKPESERARLILRTLDERYYYYTRYGSPLAYARAIDLLAANGLNDVAGRKILDFGYGTVGHLRLLASLGADVVGVEVDPILPVLYGQERDQGAVPRHGASRDEGEGRLRLIDGRFPSDPLTREMVGEGYDVFISKNTLKRGYIHPSQPVDRSRLVDLGVDDAAFVRTLAAILKPGGLALIYNLSPAPARPGEPYKPWAEGESPFAREVWEAAGFEVIAFDAVDDEAGRAMAKALGWDQGETPMDLQNDLFVRYTLARRGPPAPPASPVEPNR